MSLMSASKALPLARMRCRYSVCVGSETIPKRISVKPSTAFMGVRISCDMFARNSLFVRFASSAT